MTTLNVASKANQATTLPAVLIAYYIQESDPNAAVNVHFEEVESLASGDKAAVELLAGDGTTTNGTEQVIRNFLKTYHFLQAKHEKPVS